MSLDIFMRFMETKWAKIYNRFLAKYFLIEVTIFEPPHSAQLKTILNLLNFNFGLIGTSILGEFKFTKLTYFIIINLLFVFIVLIYTVNCIFDDTSLLLQDIILFGVFIPSAIVVYDLFVNNRKYMSLVEFSLHVFEINNNAKRVAILDAQIKNSKEYLQKIVSIVVLAMSIYAAGAVYLIYLKQLPAPFYIPFVDHTTSIGYVITLIVQIGNVILVAVLHFPFLVLFSLLTLHYDNLVALIQYDFKQLSKIVPSSKSEKVFRTRFFNKIVIQIIESRRYTKYINDLFKKIILWQTAMAYFSTAILIFVIIAFKWYIGTVAFIYFLAEIYIMCYLGQFMSNTNNKLADVIYSVDWNVYSIREQKTILSLLHMTQFNYVELWIGIFAPLSIETGFMITKNIYSYTMLLFKIIDY